jgi:hypothetical protein
VNFDDSKKISGKHKVYMSTVKPVQIYYHHDNQEEVLACPTTWVADEHSKGYTPMTVNAWEAAKGPCHVNKEYRQANNISLTDCLKKHGCIAPPAAPKMALMTDKDKLEGKTGGINYQGTNLKASTNNALVDFLKDKADIKNKGNDKNEWFKPRDIECSTQAERDNHTRCTTMTRGDCNKLCEMNKDCDVSVVYYANGPGKARTDSDYLQQCFMKPVAKDEKGTPLGYPGPNFCNNEKPTWAGWMDSHYKTTKDYPTKCAPKSTRNPDLDKYPAPCQGVKGRFKCVNPNELQNPGFAANGTCQWEDGKCMSK